MVISGLSSSVILTGRLIRVFVVFKKAQNEYPNYGKVRGMDASAWWKMV